MGDGPDSDGHTFEFNRIGEGATIRLSQLDYEERDEAYYIYVQRTEGEVFRFRIKSSDIIGSLKTRLWKGQLTSSSTGKKTFIKPTISITLHDSYIS